MALSISQKQAIDNQVYAQALKMGVPAAVAKNIVAQARYETADYTNTAFVKFNNAFGYKYVGQKKWPIGVGNAAGKVDASGNPDGGSYAAYKNVADSTGELVDWLYRRERENKFKVASLTDTQKYAAALKAGGYYGESVSNYATGIYSKLKKLVLSNPVASLITAAAIGTAVFFC